MIEAALLSRPTLWCARPIVVTVRGPDGTPVITHVDKPFARVGSHPDCEVVLRGDDVPPRCLYLHATEHGIYCLGLKSGELAAAPPNGWLRPKVHARLGPYRINASFDDDGPPPRHLDLDPRARDSAADGTLRLRIESQAEQRPLVQKSWRRQLTLVGRLSPSTLRLVHPKVSKTHCVLFYDRDMLWAVDLLSSRGTRVDGRRIEATQVLPGQVLEVGGIRLTYLADNQPLDFLPDADSARIFTAHEFGPASLDEIRDSVDQVTLRPGHASEEAAFFRKRIALVEAELGQARRALADSRQDAQVRTGLSEQLANDLEATRARLAAVEEQLEEARRWNQEQQSQWELEEADLREAGGRVAAELESLRARLAQDEEERARLAADASARATLAAEVDRLTAGLSEARERLEQAQARHQQETEQFEAQRGERQERSRDLEQQLAGVEEARREMENALAAERTRNAEMEQNLADADLRRIELERQFDGARAGVAKIERELAGLDKRHAQLEQQLDAERVRSAKLGQELLQERTRQAAETGHAEPSGLLAEQLGRSERQLAEAEQKLAATIEQLAAVGQRLDAVEHQWADAEQQRADLEKQWTLAQRQAADAEEQRADVERQLKAAGQQLLIQQAENQKQALELAGQIERATAERAAVEIEFDGYQRETAERQAETGRRLAEVEAICARLREELEQATARRDELESSSPALAARLNQEQARQAELEQALGEQRVAAQQLDRILSEEREALRRAEQSASEAARAAERQRVSLEQDWGRRYEALLAQQELERAETERLRLQVEELIQERQSLERARSGLAERLEATEASRAQSEQAIEHERRSAELGRRQLEDQLASERAASEHLVAGAHDSQEEWSRKHQALDQELRRQQAVASQLRVQLEGATAERHEAETAREALAGRLADAASHGEALQEELDLLRRSADEQGQRIGELEAALKDLADEARQQVARVEERCHLLQSRCRRTIQLASRFRVQLEEQNRIAAAAAGASRSPEQFQPSASRAGTAPTPAAQRDEPRRGPAQPGVERARASRPAEPVFAPAEVEADELFLDQLLDLHAGNGYGKRRLVWIALGGAALAAAAAAVVYGNQLFGG